MTTDERLPVWQALSELFLDTQMQDFTCDDIAKTLAKSEYSIDQLQDILFFEVYPVCKYNLLSVAGEWTGFDPDWIMEHIAPRKDKRPFLRIGPLFKGMVMKEWRKIAQLINQKRTA